MKYIIFKPIILIFILSGIVACEHKKTKENTVRATDVEVARIARMQPQKKIIVPGELKAWQEIRVYAKVKGFVKSVNADRGAVVKEGQILAVLDAPEVRAELSEAKARLYSSKSVLAEHKAKFQASKAHYNRMLQASKVPGAVSPNDLDETLAKMLMDSSSYLSAEENVNAANSYYQSKAEIVQYLTVTAPFSGTITERNISPGALVGPDEASEVKPMYVLENSEKLRLTVAVPEVYANELQDNCKVTFQVSSLPEKTFNACLSRSARSLQEGIRSMFAEFDINNTKHELKKGMYTDVSLPIQRTISTLFVPKTAVVSSMEKTFIIKVIDDKAVWTTVKKGNVVDDIVEIFSDEIKDGDRVVKVASEEIRNGEKLRVIK
ncbi:MAG TPA: efflux RND transporter periplasmic adaptor subunit [Cytophagaceae bacterium]|jgi:membrane fusion protein (multidrug efflux system)|nr:efflux RND transporter periplasmic adaptor subunit [Cytophagaceae bacterium]